MLSSLACESYVCVISLELFLSYLILAFPFGTTGNKFKIQTYLVCSTRPSKWLISSDRLSEGPPLPHQDLHPIEATMTKWLFVKVNHAF